MRLYLLHRCPFGHRAAFALAEKGLSYETVFFEQGKRPPELEALGPYAKSPTLFDGEVKVWDSAIVLEYLEDKQPSPRLLPADARGRADARMFMSRAGAELAGKMGTIVVETKHKPKPDEAKVAEASRDFVAALERWDRDLAGKRFLLGDTFTLADITLFTIFPAIQHLAGVEIPPERANLRAWHQRIADRPASKLPAPPAS